MVAAEPYLEALSNDIGDTIFLTVRTGNDALCVARKIGTYPIQVLSINIGARRPLGVSSAGIAILTAMSPADARRIARENELRFGPYKVTLKDVEVQISAARRSGYFVRDVGLVRGTRSISAWIKGPAGAEAAITVSAIRARLGPRREIEVAESVVNSAASIQRALVRPSNGHRS
ncbi:IclR family transcriptional regulator domain-containing protein [Bradyrhizobium tropiciagri]|uniref:IclR family transcriptional regulator domain-containing protein n=1 Tax=Bradyrhizobium tropiciagri TaxID=312253 RepID=UPI0032DF4453